MNANRKSLGREYAMFGTKRGRGQRRNNNDSEELCLKKVGLTQISEHLSSAASNNVPR